MACEFVVVEDLDDDERRVLVEELRGDVEVDARNDEHLVPHGVERLHHNSRLHHLIAQDNARERVRQPRWVRPDQVARQEDVRAQLKPAQVCAVAVFDE